MTIEACTKCEGTGKVEGKHKPGYTHYYMTDSDEELCPFYHFEAVMCPQCHGKGTVMVLDEGDQ